MDEVSAHTMGIRTKSLKMATNHGQARKTEFARLLYGDIRALVKEVLADSIDYEPHASPGKRFVQLREAQWALQWFVSNEPPEGHSALLLTGTVPALACKPWAKMGIAFDFIGYESDPYKYWRAFSCLPGARRQVGNQLTPLWVHKGQDVRAKITVINGDILDDRQDKVYSVIDTDFCRSYIRDPADREHLLELIARQGPPTGPFVFRTTVHVGHTDNSRGDIRRHTREFKEGLERSGFDILASNRSSYHCMMSLIYILERL